MVQGLSQLVEPARSQLEVPARSQLVALEPLPQAARERRERRELSQQVALERQELALAVLEPEQGDL